MQEHKPLASVHHSQLSSGSWVTLPRRPGQGESRAVPAGNAGNAGSAAAAGSASIAAGAGVAGRAVVAGSASSAIIAAAALARRPVPGGSSHACASNPSALPIRSRIVYTGRVSLATRSRNARTPVRPASPNRPAAAPAAPAPPIAVRFLPRLVGTLAKPSVIPASSAGIQGPPSREAAGILAERPAPTRSVQRSPVGERFPIAMPRFRPVASGRPERTPNPAEKGPASPQEFFRKNSYCARGAPFHPSGRPSNRPAAPCRDHVRLLFG